MKLELPDVQTGFWRGREPEIKSPTFVGSWRKQRNSRKTSISASLTMLKSLTVWTTPVQFTSVPQSCPILCDPMDCSMPGFPIHHQLLEFTQIHIHWIGDVIQPFHPLSSPSPPAFNLSQNQGVFQWVSSSHQVPKVLEFQLQHQSFQWIFRTDFL